MVEAGEEGVLLLRRGLAEGDAMGLLHLLIDTGKPGLEAHAVFRFHPVAEELVDEDRNAGILRPGCVGGGEDQVDDGSEQVDLGAGERLGCPCRWRGLGSAAG